MALSNLYKNILKITISQKYLEESIVLVNGSGNLSNESYYDSGIAEYNGEVHECNINEKTVTLSGGYSGEVLVKYYAKSLAKTTLFNLIVSGITQIQTLLCTIYIKVKGNANQYIQKYMRSNIKVIFYKKSVIQNVLKGFVNSIKYNLLMYGKIGSKKNISDIILFNISILEKLPVLRNFDIILSQRFMGSCEVTVGRYRLLSEFSSSTLANLLDVQLEDMIYRQI